MRTTISIALVLITSITHHSLAQEVPASSANSETAQDSAATSPELDAIRSQSQAFVDAFNQHDAKALATLWTDDAEYIDDSGNIFSGRESIEQMYASYFSENADTKIQIAIDSLRQVSDNVVIEDGRALVQPPPEGAAGVSKYTAVHVRVDNAWRMASVRDTWLDTPATRESTVDLDWLIGKWVAEEHGNRSESVFTWVADESFVQRTYTTTSVDGTKTSGVQLIGWNPIAGSVQSWNFSADGGHAVGLWSLTQTGWVADITGVTGDGQPTTSINQLTRLDDNAYRWQSIGRTIGGVALPDTDEVVIKRVSSKN